ncbi:MAG: UDP-N-acetylmuramyl-tripeptide synthetase [Planctomycetaceae bacterium]|nr:UDP-N-acetylmuramyl-tripeptide synthetase [Planctomycetaceae bacterium]MBT7916879.1 UDP-N-acetylmuramyl-tripeptide synthetase [Planctomycetaceae bacterium]
MLRRNLLPDVDILDCLANCLRVDTQGLSFTGFTSDAAACEPGNLFFAIDSDTGDGHDDIATVAANGATAIVSERILPTNIPTFVVPDTRVAYANTAHYLAGSPTQRLRTIGISGASGKTAATYLIQQVFRHLGKTTGALSDIGFDNGIDVADFPDIKPDSKVYANWLGSMAANKCQIACVELSDSDLADQTSAGIDLDYAVITRLTNFQSSATDSAQQTRRAASNAINSLKSTGVVIINADDAASRFDLPRIENPTLTIGSNDDCDIWVEHLNHSADGQRIRIHAGAAEAVVFTPIIGHHHVYHCLQVTALALLEGYPLPEIADAISQVNSIQGHLERISRGQDFEVYIDAANSPIALRNALHSVRQITLGRLIVVYGPGANTGASFRADMGRIAEKAADITIITENDPGNEQTLSIAHDILDGYRRPGNAEIIISRERAIVWALAHANTDDTVLITGKGFRTQHQLGDQTLFFDDHQIADICLDQLLYPEPVYGTDLLPFPKAHGSSSEGTP